MSYRTTFEPNVPGIYEIPAAQYHAAPGVSNSMLSHMDPPARLPVYLTEERDPTDAMQLGTFIHSRILEPAQPLPRLVVKPATYPAPPTHALVKSGEKKPGDPLPWSGGAKWCKEWVKEQEAAGRIVVTADYLDRLVGCVDAIRTDPTCRRIFANGHAEVSVFSEFDLVERDILKGHNVGPSNRVLVRSRLDWLPATSNAIVDVKKVSKGKGSPREFTRLLLDRRYHVQAALYLDQWNHHMAQTDPRDCFVFIVVEDEAPFLVSKFVVGSELIELGRRQYRADLRTYAQCSAHPQSWPGYPDEIQTLTAPEWLLRKEGL